MPSLYGDHNVSRYLARLLREHGHTATNARELGLERATDGAHLLLAAERGWLLLTHNERDFVLLHDAWLRWSRSWGIAPQHAGILVLPQREDWGLTRTVSEIEAFLAVHPATINELYAWRASRGWVSSADLTAWRGA